MSTSPRDPHDIPDDAGVGELAAYVGEDVGRIIMLRVAALAAVLSLVAGAMSESASATLKTTCLSAGGAGIVLLLLAQLFRWRRSRQWVAILLVTLVCVGLLVAVFLGSRT
ncbi:hypothetical protein [Nocardioides currus]|uniref:Uncharacterized protein n=1 Tax=Nocardioides currus TaxID=2133958 RepID=A0A2R7YTP8_9ACTN|nr:hypothetical protein [Nocardioides currus]PUA79767.1 hypothetical protein C7S10_16935 [Nocardioides currus]